MGRLPAIRVSYSNDANYLFRLVNAIERDNSRPSDWKARVIPMVQSLAMEFMEAPSASSSTEEEKPKKKAKRTK